jgi:hypothetical protein
MELDDLKKRWEEQDRKLDASIRLDTALLRASVLGKTGTALRLLVASLVIDLAIALWLGSFVADHVAQTRFLVPGAALLVGVIALAILSVRQIEALSQVDYDAPIVTIQKRLESLRVERIRSVKWTLLLAPLAWTPLLIVAQKALVGVDAYAIFDTAWLAGNVVFGLLVIAVAVWVSRRYEDRMERSPLVRSLMRDLAGYNLNAAAAFLGSLSEFEKEEAPS